ncbi:hypothetical protein MMC31_000719 [Peltigera leucophlebia]|nr:hypothetical protein [Peltigera leucophlebia]
MSPPMEDWVLFPDEVIKCKNSSVRNPQSHAASRSSLRPDKSLGCPSSATQTASITTMKPSSQSLIAHASQDRSRSLRTSDQPDFIKKSLDTATKDIGGKPPKVKASRRLPTPDLSDLEEDDFWSCCGSAASSRVTKHSQKVEDGVVSDEHVGLLGRDQIWETDIISIAGNHDRGSAGDIIEKSAQRFEKAGICVDSPYFDFHSDEDGGGVKEQKHLSYHVGKGTLEGIYGMSGNPDAPGGGFRNGINLTEHEHEGCDVYHHLPDPDDKSNDARIWKAKRWDASIRQVLRSNKTAGIRETTLQSIMVEFRGGAGLLSTKFGCGTGEWMTKLSSCVSGKQHIWWAVHVFDLIMLGSVLTVGLLRIGIEGLQQQGNGVGNEPQLIPTREEEGIRIVPREMPML